MKYSIVIRAAGALCLAMLIAGCGGEPDIMAPEDTVFGEQVKALNKAKAVEELLLQSHADRDEALRKQGD